MNAYHIEKGKRSRNPDVLPRSTLHLSEQSRTDVADFPRLQGRELPARDAHKEFHATRAGGTNEFLL